MGRMKSRPEESTQRLAATVSAAALSLVFSFRELWHRQVFDRSSASGAVVAPLEATPSSSPLMRTTGLLVMSPLISPSASREEATITPSTGGIPE